MYVSLFLTLVLDVSLVSHSISNVSKIIVTMLHTLSEKISVFS